METRRNYFFQAPLWGLVTWLRLREDDDGVWLYEVAVKTLAGVMAEETDSIGDAMERLERMCADYVRRELESGRAKLVWREQE